MRVLQAPTETLPELAQFLEPFHIHFARSEGPAALERYLTGLLTEQPDKNCDTIAQVVPGTSEQRLQGLLTEMVWDEDDLNRQRVRRMLCLPSEGNAVLIFDDTGFAKQGKSAPSASSASTPAPSASVATVRSVSTATTPRRPWPGPWRCDSICPSNGPTIPSAGPRPTCPRR